MRKVIATIGYLLIVFFIVFLYLDYQAGKPVSQSQETKIFIIEKGDSLKEIGAKLEKENLVKDKNVFILYSFFRNLRKSFLPGRYELKENSTLKEIINLLTSPLSQEKKITIIEGWNLSEIAFYLEKEGIVKKENFLEIASKPELFKEKYEFLRDEKIKNLEGFLFPDTYRVYAETSSEEIISKLLNNFDKKLTPELRERITKDNKNIFEIITLASIIEKEVFLKEDKYLVADIFYRRLANKIPLQADSTINYFTGEKKRQVSLAETKIDNPYNTYKYRGLPPGPISNPGLESILVAISPQKNEFWYFLNKEDGTTVYSQTFDEHNKNKIRYLKNKESYKKGELLVRYKNDEKIYKILFNPSRDLKEMKDELLRTSNEIELIEPNYLFEASYNVNDPDYAEQWYLKKIQAPEAWDLTPGGNEEVVIAILDSGVDIDHPDLKDNIWLNQKEIAGDKIDNDNNGYLDDINGWDFVENSPNPRPKFLPTYTSTGIHHGTVIAGLAAARGDNNQGITGLAWKTKIMPLRVLNNNGEGNVEDVIKAVNYAARNGADIINLSFVGPNRSQFLLEALKTAWQAGLVIIAAAGNDQQNQGLDLDSLPMYPICLDKDEGENFIIGVTAVNETDKKASFANYGASCVDVSAPGTKIYSALFYSNEKEEFKKYYGGYWSGTSLASPLVAATAALIKSLSPSVINNKEIRNLILENSENIDSLNAEYKEKLGRGRINAYRAVAKAHQKLSQTPYNHYIVTAAGKGSPPLIKIFTPSGLTVKEFYAYNPSFRGGVNVIAGDINGDGIKEIVTGPRAGGGPHVRIFDHNGKLHSHFFAYDKKFKGGINVAVGDVNGDGMGEIVVAPQTQSSNLPLKIFNHQGVLMAKFFAYDSNFKGGISVTAIDINNDGAKEIVTGAGQGGGPHLRIFDWQGNLKNQFFAYYEKFRGGINVTAGDLNGDQEEKIIVSIASGASPYLRIFDKSGYLWSQFIAYAPDFYGGVLAALADLDNNGESEIITVPFRQGGPHLRIFDWNGNLKNQFFTYPKTYGGGVSVTVIEKFE